ncbi:MAG TPA: RDD family protein [Candidatus Pelethosoma merdigallinarum]|nr:RDD family protein [Candidatus Pelethosoma merdigallinarum]
MHSVGMKRRLVAYLFDMMVLMGILMLIYYFLPESHNITVLNQEFDHVNDLLFSNNISFGSYLTRVASIMQELDKERILYSLINAVYIIVYFVIIPFKTKKTFGMYLMGLKYESKDGKFSVDDLLVRSMITCGLLYLLASLVLIYVLPSIAYFLTNIIFAIIQISLVVISFFMVLYRKDHRGLQDLWSRTVITRDKK